MPETTSILSPLSMPVVTGRGTGLPSGPGTMTCLPPPATTCTAGAGTSSASSLWPTMNEMFAVIWERKKEGTERGRTFTPYVMTLETFLPS